MAGRAPPLVVLESMEEASVLPSLPKLGFLEVAEPKSKQSMGTLCLFDGKGFRKESNDHETMSDLEVSR